MIARVLLFLLAPRRSTLVLSCLWLAACGGGGGGGAGAGGPAGLEGALNELGVDTSRTPRQTAPGLELERATSPLGSRPVLARIDELLLCNIGLSGGSLNGAPMLLLDLTDGNGAAAQELLHGQDATQVPFLPQPTSGAGAQSALSCAVAADLDGNGLEEIVFVHQTGIETRVRTFDDETRGFVGSDVQIAVNGTVTDVTAIAADLDLDGRDELLVGVTGGGIGRVTAWRRDAGAFVQVGAEVQIQPDMATAKLTLQLAAGNLDSDAAPEIAIAVQEVLTGTGTARCIVIDDSEKAFAVLRDELFTARDQNQILRVAFTASVAIGDVDGDGLGEVLLAGLTEFATGCNATAMLLQALDDREHQFAELDAFWRTRSYSGCDSPSNRRIRTIHLHALDYDGDGRDEIAANEFVFEDFAADAVFTEIVAWRLPDSVMWHQGAFGMFDRLTTSFATGDFTGDDREDLAVYRQDVGSVDVYGLPGTATATTLHRRITVPNQNSQTARHPMLLPVNVDTDSPVLEYSAADYALVFSEPIVLAALAAPPTKNGVGQNVASSFTAFGNTDTTTSERERSLTFSAGVTIGVNFDGGPLTQSEASLKQTLTVAAERTVGIAYELSRTILFTSAPQEDLVVFTSVPVDTYTFTILSHPDPTLVGQKVQVGYPRAPVTMQAERAFFNATVPEQAVRIDATVFQHTIGDPSSYPNVAERNALRAGAVGGSLQVGPIGTGQGGGSTEVTLQVGTAVSQGGALAVNFERDLEVTSGGVLAGVTIGVAAESRWKVSTGSQTTYTGVVGAIDAPNFAANRYSFGLFTYVHRDPRTAQQFQVLNYWVE